MGRSLGRPFFYGGNMSWNEEGRAYTFENVTPHATNANEYDALYVGTTGNVEVVGSHMADNATGIVFNNVPSGTFLPIAVKRVLAANTTATNIIGLKVAGLR